MRVSLYVSLPLLVRFSSVTVRLMSVAPPFLFLSILKYREHRRSNGPLVGYHPRAGRQAGRQAGGHVPGSGRPASGIPSSGRQAGRQAGRPSSRM